MSPNAGLTYFSDDHYLPDPPPVYNLAHVSGLYFAAQWGEEEKEH